MASTYRSVLPDTESFDSPPSTAGLDPQTGAAWHPAAAARAATL